VSDELAPARDEPARPAGSPGIDLARSVLAAARATSRKRSARRDATAAGTARSPAAGEPAPGEPAGRRGDGRPADRDPQPLGRAIERLLADRGWQTPAAVGGAIGRWAEIVGADVAAHCTPESFDAGVLRVATDSTAWATQVRLLAPQFLARLNAVLGQGTVTRIEVRGPAGPTWRRGGRSVRGGRGPRDTYG
jgi:predicted nucleic acid-binding Zn ribbon protein